MDCETRRYQERERLVRAMATKLATGKGIEVIAASRRGKKVRSVIYISASVLLFIITAIVIFVKSPGTSAVLKSDQAIAQRTSLLQLLHQDLENRKITVNQYALYLRDILIRYDSLPPQYQPQRPIVVTEEIYDSLCAVWSKIDLKNRAQLFKELPKIDAYLKEFQYKRSNHEE